MPTYEEEKTVKCTETLKKIIKRLEWLRRGTLHRHICQEQAQIELPALRSYEGVAGFLRIYVDLFLKARSRDYLPRKKGSMPKVDACSFFVTFKIEFSWLLWTRENKKNIQLLPEVQDRELLILHIFLEQVPQYLVL